MVGTPRDPVSRRGVAVCGSGGVGGAGTCGLGPHTVYVSELRVGRRGVGAGVSLVLIVKMMTEPTS